MTVDWLAIYICNTVLETNLIVEQMNKTNFEGNFFFQTSKSEIFAEKIYFEFGQQNKLKNGWISDWKTEITYILTPP